MRFNRICCLALVLALLPGVLYAGVEWKTLQKIKLEKQVLDVTVSSNGNLIFALTPGKILIYSSAEGTLVDQMPVDTIYTRITYSNNERLILSSADPATLQVLKYDRVYDINITNRPFKGPRDAVVTLVVFDDYQ